MKAIFHKSAKHKCLYTLFAIVISVFILNTANADNLLEKGIKTFFGAGENGSREEATAGEIKEAFKQALRIGSENVVEQLGQEDGFNEDPAVHIPLPEKLDVVKSVLAKTGLSFLTDNLELKLNRAAEKATPEAKKLFLQAIKNMSFEDVMKIYEGPKDSATKYFKSRMSGPLAEEMRPIIKNSLSQVGAVQTYNRMMDEYDSIPLVPEAKANLTDYVTKKGMEGIFYYMAEEEAAIRENPAKQTTELLKRVFGTK
ncbi:MAG: DUF4197 domain-containing protein [Desulfobacterales bacterium]|nr:DUF4197 domain-containing protein [Desulfobacterales bacterium]